MRASSLMLSLLSTVVIDAGADGDQHAVDGINQADPHRTAPNEIMITEFDVEDLDPAQRELYLALEKPLLSTLNSIPPSVKLNPCRNRDEESSFYNSFMFNIIVAVVIINRSNKILMIG